MLGSIEERIVAGLRREWEASFASYPLFESNQKRPETALTAWARMAVSEASANLATVGDAGEAVRLWEMTGIVFVQAFVVPGSGDEILRLMREVVSKALPIIDFGDDTVLFSGTTRQLVGPDPPWMHSNLVTPFTAQFYT